MSVRKEIEELTRLRHISGGRTDEEDDAYNKIVDANRDKISSPEEFAAYLRFLAVDMERSSDPMKTTQWEFLNSLADVIDTDVVGTDGTTDPKTAWAVLALACEDAIE